MLTRFGWSMLVAAAGSIAAGRVFGLIELYVLSVGLVAAVLLAVVLANVGRPKVTAARSTDPPAPVAGSAIRVIVSLTNSSRRAQPELFLRDRVGTLGSASMTLAPIRKGQRIQASYSIPAPARGILPCGPLTAHHSDPLGLAATRKVVLGVDEILVGPVTTELDPPQVGSAGPMGQLLKSKAVAQGGTDFHGLREYVPGDDPRRISWRASARSTELLIREHADDDLKRLTIVLDRAMPADQFELAISAAASIVGGCAASEHEVELRLISQGADWRGADILVAAERWFATVQADPQAPPDVGGTTSTDGLSVLVLVGRTADSPFLGAARRRLGRNATIVAVLTDDGAIAGSGAITVPASSLEALHDAWNFQVNGEVGRR